MTPKEKARWIVDHYRHIGPEDSQAIMNDIEAAIEEDRKTRECCKAEREDCAKVVQDEIKTWEEIGIGSSDFRIDALTEALDKIRARSDS